MENKHVQIIPFLAFWVFYVYFMLFPSISYYKFYLRSTSFSIPQKVYPRKK